MPSFFSRMIVDSIHKKQAASVQQTVNGAVAGAVAGAIVGSRRSLDDRMVKGMGQGAIAGALAGAAAAQATGNRQAHFAAGIVGGGLGSRGPLGPSRPQVHVRMDRNSNVEEQYPHAMDRELEERVMAQRQKFASAFAHAAELAGLGILAAPSIQSFRGKPMSDRSSHKANIAGLAVLAAPSLLELAKRKKHAAHNALEDMTTMGRRGAAYGAGIGAGIGAMNAALHGKSLTNIAVNALSGAGLGYFTGRIGGSVFGAGRAHQERLMAKKAATRPPWQRPAPKDAGDGPGLSAAWRAKAKARAEAAGRKYPNLVDNMWASQASKKSEKTAANLMPPDAVRAAAKRGLEARRKAPMSQRGGLTSAQAGAQGIGSGVVRAQTLASGRSVSPETVKRMHAFFSRHRKNKDTPKGRIAWDLWGGDAGAAWAARQVAEMNSKKTAGLFSMSEDDKLGVSAMELHRKETGKNYQRISGDELAALKKRAKSSGFHAKYWSGKKTAADAMGQPLFSPPPSTRSSLGEDSSDCGPSEPDAALRVFLSTGRRRFRAFNNVSRE